MSAGLGDIGGTSGRLLSLPEASGLCHVLFFLTIRMSSTSSSGDTVCASVHPGARDMGSKLSTPGSDPTAQCPGTEDIHTAYKQGNPGRARHLLREACDESTSQLEKVRS